MPNRFATNASGETNPPWLFSDSLENGVILSQRWERWTVARSRHETLHDSGQGVGSVTTWTRSAGCIPWWASGV